MKIIWKQSYTGMSYNNSFENRIRDKFAHAKMMPSAKVWEGLSQHLQGEEKDRKKVLIIPFYRRKENLRWAGLAAVLALMASLWLTTLDKQLAEPAQETPSLAEAGSPDPAIQQAAAGEDLIKEQTAGTTPTAVEVLPPSPSNLKASAPEKASASEEEFRLLAQHEVVEPAAEQLSQESRDHLTPLEPIRPVELGSELSLQVPKKLPVYATFVPTRENRKRPRLAWGATAMASLQMQPLSGTFISPASDVSLAGAEAIATNLQFPRAFSGLSARLEYFLRNNLSLETGLGYVNSQQDPAWMPQRQDMDELRNNQSNSGSPTQGYNLQTVNDISFASLDVPLLLNYYLGAEKGRSALMLSTGMLFQHRMTREPDRLTEMLYRDNTLLDTRYQSVDENTLNLGNLVYWVGRVHYHLQLNSQLALHMGPSLSYGLGPAFQLGEQSSLQPLNLGLEFGIRLQPRS
jgi:hypothetical protein